MNQIPLLRGPHFPSIFRYETLFGHLPAILEQGHLSRGRKPYNPNVLLRALIYRCLRQIPTLTELAFELENNPSLADCLGLDPIKALPCIERFSAFLRDTDNNVFQAVRLALVTELAKEGVISGKVVALDSCSVVPFLRENNLKTRIGHSRFDKNKPPKGDPETGVGVRIHFTGERDKKVTYFWGYRNHTVSDTESELTLWEETHPANVSEVRRAVPMLQGIRQLNLPIAFVAADSEYDVETILSFIVHDLGAQPMIAHNPRGKLNTSYRIEGNKIYCAANLPMAHRGTCTSGGHSYRQYGCALHWLKKLQRKYLLCPIGHPKFLERKGCNILIRVTASLRTQIPYGSNLFSEIYRKRTAIERSYSRLLTITMQHPTVRGLKATSNHCTIAHIATLLIALTAAKMGEKDKIRWIKSFVPNFLKT
jgi:hypothetical protein